MGFMDKAKQMADKAVDAAKQNTDKIGQGIDKAGDMADKATKGKYSDKIDSFQDKAKDQVDKLDAKTDQSGTPGTTGAGTTDAPATGTASGTRGAQSLPSDPGTSDTPTA